MDAARQRLIASMGGKAAWAKGAAHKWNPETAKAAGSKGGRESARRKAAKRVRPIAVERTEVVEVSV